MSTESTRASLAYRKRLLRPNYLQSSLHRQFESIETANDLSREDKIRLKVVLAHDSLVEARRERAEALRYHATLTEQEIIEAEEVVRTLTTNPGAGPNVLLRILEGTDRRAAAPEPRTVPNVGRVPKVAPGPVHEAPASISRSLPKLTAREGRSELRPRPVGPVPARSDVRGAASENQVGAVPRQAPKITASAFLAEARGATSGPVQADIPPQSQATRGTCTSQLPDPGSDRARHEPGIQREPAPVGDRLRGLPARGGHGVRPDTTRERGEVRQTAQAVPAAAPEGGLPHKVAKSKVAYRRNHPPAPSMDGTPGEVVDRVDGDPVHKILKANYQFMEADAPVEEVLRSLTDTLLSDITVDLDHYVDRATGAVLRTVEGFPFPSNGADIDPTAILVWVENRIRAKHGSLYRDGGYVELTHIKARRSPSGSGLHLKCRARILEPGKRKLRPATRSDALTIRRDLGDDPSRWMYDLRRAHADAGAAGGWLSDANRRNTGEGKTEYKIERAGPWVKIA